MVKVFNAALRKSHRFKFNVFIRDQYYASALEFIMLCCFYRGPYQSSLLSILTTQRLPIASLSVSDAVLGMISNLMSLYKVLKGESPTLKVSFTRWELSTAGSQKKWCTASPASESMPSGVSSQLIFSFSFCFFPFSLGWFLCDQARPVI